MNEPAEVDGALRGPGAPDRSPVTVDHGSPLARGLGATLLVSLVAIGARLRPFRNADVLWQIRTGDVVLATRARVDTDRFTYGLRGAKIHDHEPAFEALLAIVDRAGGLVLLWWINLALAVVAVGVSFHAARRLVGGAIARLIATSLVVTAVAARFELRAEAASFLAIAVAHAIRRKANDRHGSMAWTPRLLPIPIAALAAPFHGLSLLVALVPAAHVGEELVLHRRSLDLRRLGVDLLVMVATILAAEAAAPGMIANVVGNAAGVAFVHHIIEGYSPLQYVIRTHDVFPVAQLTFAMVATAGLVRLSRLGRARLADALLVAAMIVPGLRYLRFTPLAAVAALPWTIAGVAAVVELALPRIRRGLAVGLAVIVALASFVVGTEDLGKDATAVGFDWSRQPVGAVRWLREHRPDAALFHPYNFGAYLIYAQYPPRGVIIDPRAATVYPNDYAERYYRAIEDPVAFEAWAKEAPFDTVLLQKRHKSSEGLRAHLAQSPDWVMAYDDLGSIVFVRAP